MKQSAAVKQALDSYHFQYGKRADNLVVKQLLKVVKHLEERERMEVKHAVQQL